MAHDFGIYADDVLDAIRRIESYLAEVSKGDVRPQLHGASHIGMRNLDTLPYELVRTDNVKAEAGVKRLDAQDRLCMRDRQPRQFRLAQTLSN